MSIGQQSADTVKYSQQQGYIYIYIYIHGCVYIYMYIHHDDDITLYKAQVVCSAYIPVDTSMEVYPTTDKTEAMQFQRYCSKYYCNPADKTEATQLPKGRVCR